jgi:TNF receptor-associated protein 1
MTKEELVDNLGTIAKSGSKNFLEKIGKGDSSQVAENIIGQFGVGFYSSFIVGDTIEVVSRSAAEPNAPAHLWVSDGHGTFEIAEVDDPTLVRGTRITIHLKPECAHFAKKTEIQKIIEKYSNFINFPINLNGDRVNLVSAIWTRDRKELTDNDYKKFWESLANTKIDYKYKLHFSTDVPISIKSVLYVPNTHAEQYFVRV